GYYLGRTKKQRPGYSPHPGNVYSPHPGTAHSLHPGYHTYYHPHPGHHPYSAYEDYPFYYGRRGRRQRAAAQRLLTISY
ncbi:hypothetical protein SK128_002290, partial [Halocaridina rubra]